MRKVLVFSFLVVFLVGAFLAQPGWSHEKRALGEMFTNTSCGPCKPANDQVDKWTDPNHTQYVENWVVIRYHTSWPSPNDPFYAANKTQNNARKNYYGVNYVPDMWLGNVHGTSSYSTWDNKAQTQIGQTTPYEVYLYGSFDPITWEICVDAHVVTDDDVPSVSDRLFLVVTQDDVHFNAPNGQTVFYQAMMNMLNGSTGQSIGPMSKGDYQQFGLCVLLDPDWPSPSISIDYNETNITAFIQDYNTKEIKQVSTKKIVDLTPAPLWSDSTEISASAGADEDLHISTDSSYAGRSYFLFTGVSGSSPGVPLPGGTTVLPLIWDVYTDFMVPLVNSPVYANFMGNLDADGEATANFNSFGALDPAFVGFTTYYAWTLFSPFNRVSNSFELPIIP